MRNGMDLFFSRIGLAVKGFASSSSGPAAASFVSTSALPKVSMRDWVSGIDKSNQVSKNDFPKTRRTMEESTVVLDVTATNPSARELRRLDKIRQFLKEQEMADPSASLEAAVRYPAVDSSLARVAGRFEGLLQAENGSLQKMSFMVNLEESKMGVRAHLSGAFGDEGDPSSRRLRADYYLRYLATKGMPGATFLQIADNAFLQMYYVKNLDIWIANYYNAVRNGRYELVGRVRFMRSKASEEEEVTFAATYAPEP